MTDEHGAAEVLGLEHARDVIAEARDAPLLARLITARPVPDQIHDDDARARERRRRSVPLTSVPAPAVDEDDGGRLTAAARERRAHRVAHLEAVAGLHGPELGAGSLLRGFDLDRSVDGNGRLALLDRSDPIVGLHGWRVGRRFSSRLAGPLRSRASRAGLPLSEHGVAAACRGLDTRVLAGRGDRRALRKRGRVEHLGVGDGLRFHARAALDHRLQRGRGLRLRSGDLRSDPAPRQLVAADAGVDDSRLLTHLGERLHLRRGRELTAAREQRQAGEKGRPGFRNRCASEHRSGVPDRDRRGYAAGPVPWA